MIHSKIEKLNLQDKADKHYILLPALTSEQEEMINPLVPPTSGIRMILMEEKGDEFFISAERQYLFLRVFKAISDIAKSEFSKDSLGILLTSDDRPSANLMVEWAAKILAFDKHKLYFQKPVDSKSKMEAKNAPFYSRMGTPHGSATVALSDKIDVSIVITASHNERIWNGIKFYFKLPMPISGRVMQAVSEQALTYKQIPYTSDFQVQYMDANKINNEYIIKLVGKIINFDILQDKPIILWPYLGHAPEIQDIFERVGAKVHLIPQQMEPPNPTISIDFDRLKQAFSESGAKVAILLDSDRDRVVIVEKSENKDDLTVLMPNTIYAAMHNLLINEFNHEIINVRTIPTDPRCDKNAKLSYLTGVGYKHLGMILYGALDYEIEPVKFETGILYEQNDQGNLKIENLSMINQKIVETSFSNPEQIMVLWEESGGHTFNLIKKTENSLTSSFPAIGDKYPAPALLVVATLIYQGFDLENAVDSSILGLRTKIPADDKQKIAIVKHFSTKVGQSLKVEKFSYTINTFEQVAGETAIIHLHSSNSDLYFRPSGTGPGVRIYIFGDKFTAEEELKTVENYLLDKFHLEK